LLAFVEENGGSMLNDSRSAATIDSPAARGAVDFYLGLVRDGLAALPSDLGEGWCGQAIADGKVAIAFEGNWLLPIIKDSGALSRTRTGGRLLTIFPCNSCGFCGCVNPSSWDLEPPRKSSNLSPEPSPKRGGRWRRPWQLARLAVESDRASVIRAGLCVIAG
jgi:ABC-type glycerol-3-phosphate transport system substrate-binding protein